MKLASLLAGVAAATLVAGAASADVVYQGSAAGGVAIGPFPVGVEVTTNSTFFGLPAGAAAVLVADGLYGDNSAAPVSVFTISGYSAGNNGTASDTDGATFTMNGTVSTDCAYYSNNSVSNVNFGTIGIYASDTTGPANAFDMTAPATLKIETNLAGCNTSNQVSLSKNDIRGLVNNGNTGGYDSNVFQANLPYKVDATYTAGAVGSTAGASTTTLTLPEANNAAQAQHGAWKSTMDLDVTIPVPTKSLLAGTYTGQLTVEIKAL